MHMETVTCLYDMAVGPKRKKLVWSEKTNKAYEEARLLILNASNLYFLQEEGEVRLYTDASKYAFGGYLAQMQTFTNQNGEVETKERPIYFYSESFNKSQYR